MSGNKKKSKKNSNYVTQKDDAKRRNSDAYQNFKYFRGRIVMIYIFAACGIAAFLFIMDQSGGF